MGIGGLSTASREELLVRTGCTLGAGWSDGPHGRQQSHHHQCKSNNHRLRLVTLLLQRRGMAAQTIRLSLFLAEKPLA
jgi:hypothetical protein